MVPKKTMGLKLNSNKNHYTLSFHAGNCCILSIQNTGYIFLSLHNVGMLATSYWPLLWGSHGDSGTLWTHVLSASAQPGPCRFSSVNTWPEAKHQLALTFLTLCICRHACATPTLVAWTSSGHTSAFITYVHQVFVTDQILAFSYQYDTKNEEAQYCRQNTGNIKTIIFLNCWRI